MTLAVWLGFLLAAIVIAVTPGPGAAISMSTGLGYGYRAALSVILGLQTALLIQLLVVALGLGALLSASETAFAATRFAGAAYLVWLGIRKWRQLPLPADSALPPPGRRGLYVQGVLVNLSNPKAIIFIAALVPQFVDPGRSLLFQYAEIAATLCLTDLAVMSGYALAAARLGRWIHDERLIRAQNRFFGGVFVAAGFLLAISSGRD